MRFVDALFRLEDATDCTCATDPDGGWNCWYRWPREQRIAHGVKYVRDLVGRPLTAGELGQILKHCG